MARIRSIKPEFWNDRKLARVSRDARLLYIALWNLSDEHGRLHGDARYVKGHCFPYDDDLGLGDTESLITELEKAGRVERYEHDGDPFLFLPTLARHQRLEAAKQPSRLPAPTDLSVERDFSAESPDKSAESPDRSGEIVAQQVAGSRLQVAGNTSSSPAEPMRIDVEQICSAVADHTQRVTRQRPKITSGWKRDARLLLDNDGRSLPEVLAVVAWVSADQFWSANILSVPKLRTQFGQLWAKSQIPTEVIPEWKRLGRLGEWDV